MSAAQRWTVIAILAGHFVSAFAALGMPPYFGLILHRSLEVNDALLAGWMYIVPTVFTALSAPWWGRLADRFGKRLLLLRAQLGLALSFLLAGFAESLSVFAFALALQGLLGGTFAASSAYLAGLLQGEQLTRGLNLMQGSARAALVTAPAVLGLFMTMDSPIEMYRYLALLPLAAALLIWRLPAAAHEDHPARPAGTSPGVLASFRQVFVLQFVFVFSTVASFPYFIVFAQERLGTEAVGLAGLLFGLPHLVYLVSAAPLSGRLGALRGAASLALGLVLLAVSLIGQALTETATGLVAWRILMGLGMTTAYLALHKLVSERVDSATAGRAFGRLESRSKWAAVAAGLSSGAAVHAFGTPAPFLIGAASLAAALCYLALAAPGLNIQTAQERR